jgi:hypothetical protein
MIGKFGPSHLKTTWLIITLLLCSWKLFPQNKVTQPQCNVAAISFALEAGGDFQQRVSDLVFKVRPLKDSRGWVISLEDKAGRDFIYPVNPALRFNSSQTIGAVYGDTAKQSLSQGRELRFLLNKSDYDAFEPYVDHALWPYNAPDPDRASDEYLDALESLHTGLLRLTILRADVIPYDTVRSAEFNAEFIAPYSFQFDSSLASHPMTCPASIMPIREQLPARIPPAERAKYQDVQDAADWKNPYLLITRDGFDVRFQGGRFSGSLSMLARTLVGLPDSAWPYGRVVAGSENGARTIGDAPIIKRNKEQADKILREVGLEVQWWPSA